MLARKPRDKPDDRYVTGTRDRTSKIRSVDVLRQKHLENVAMNVPCSDSCHLPDCTNNFDSHVADVRPSTFIPGEKGLFAARDVPPGTFVASFGVMKEVSSASEGPLGYYIPGRVTGFSQTRRLAPKHRYRKNSSHKAHACNHTCALESVNVEYVVNWEDETDQPQAWIKTSGFVREGEEFFANYGPQFELESCFCHVHEGEYVCASVV